MLISVGRVIKPRGVRGEVKVESLTDFPERFEKLDRVYLTWPSGRVLECRVGSVRYIKGIPYLVFESYETPEKARQLCGSLIQIPEQEAMPIPDGSFYWFELIGMEVFTEDERRLGVIDEILRTGGNDVYVVKNGRKEYYIPATEEVIRQVDKARRRMVIHVIEGMLD